MYLFIIYMYYHINKLCTLFKNTHKDRHFNRMEGKINRNKIPVPSQVLMGRPCLFHFGDHLKTVGDTFLTKLIK